MLDLNILADVIVSHATAMAVLSGFAVFAFIGWSRVPPFLAYAFAFMASFIYFAYSMRDGSLIPDKNLAAGYQAVAAAAYTVVLSTVYWISRIKLNFKPAQPVAKAKPKRR